MKNGKYINDVTHNIRANGGDFISTVRLGVSDAIDMAIGYAYDSIDLEVELLIPFSFSGKDMACVSKGVFKDTITWMCYNDCQREYMQATAVVAALEDAIDEAEADIYAQLLAARPTARAKRLKKKTRAVLKQLYES